MTTAIEMNELVLEAKNAEEMVKNNKAKNKCFRMITQMKQSACQGNHSKTFTSKDIPIKSIESSILRACGYTITRKGFFQKKVVVSW